MLRVRSTSAPSSHTVVFCGAILVTLSALVAKPLFAEERPNIVLIMVDDMGYSDLGCFGGEIHTPNIDRLAAKGMRFTQFTNCAKCETTRRTLLTGRYHPEVTSEGPQHCVTIPEVLGPAGYQNFMAGKWHIFDTPIDRGFDRYFGFLEGACNFFTGKGTSGKFSFRLNNEPFTVPQTGFYTTTAFTDYAIEFVEQRDKQKPFFLYVAYNAPHYPLQAPESEVSKYRNKYRDGWGALRPVRLERMKELGIVPADQTLSPTDVPAWESLSAEQRDRQDLLMATYAAMIDVVDQNVGRLTKSLEEQGVLDNTLILLLSDNGACPFDRTTQATLDNNYMPWDPRSFYCYPVGWANACNTPWSKYKQNQHEGGVSTPLIAHWPAGIKSPGRMDRQRAHLVDLHATFRQLAGASYPAEFGGNRIGPARGLSLANSFANEQRPLHDEIFYTFYGKYSALTQGDWKLVNQSSLYNLKTDRIEANDLSEMMPERFAAMKQRWQELNKEFGGKSRVGKQGKGKGKGESKGKGKGQGNSRSGGQQASPSSSSSSTK